MLLKSNILKLISIYLAITVVSLLVYFLYILQIQEGNSYMGMEPLSFSYENLFIFFVLSFIVAILFPKGPITPSRIFVGIYLMFVVMCNITLYGVAGKLDFWETLFKIFTLIFPVLFLYIVRYLLYKNIIFKLRFPYFRSKNMNIFLLIFILICATIVGYMLMGGGSFDLTSSYVRRMAGREHFGTATIYSYLFAMSLNGIAPMLSFIGFLRQKRYLIILSLFFSIYAFWLIGTKAPIFYVIMMGFLGYLTFKKQENHILHIFLIILIAINLLALLEYLLFNFSVIADLFTRRAIAVVAQNQSYFIDYFFKEFSSYNMFFGHAYNKPITFIIGDLYYNSPNTNVNTNTFLYALLKNGFIGFFATTAFTSFFFLILDMFYEKYHIKEILGISILYALLLSEQYYTTALLSSGIAFVLILFVFFRKPDEFSHKRHTYHAKQT